MMGISGDGTMDVVDTLAAVRAARQQMPGQIGLVPTMGALHEGHLALVEQARHHNDFVIATIFVNPAQFAANEDFAAYPRDLHRDLALFEQAGVRLVLTPSVAQMYPPEYETYVSVEQISQGLEADHRPGHFRGVATVVAKLLNLTQPHRAYFGQKDAQQVAVIRAMVRDLNFPVEIIVCPTVREADGLAMSSRNRYLQPEERRKAVYLWRALQAAALQYEQGERDPSRLTALMTETFAALPAVQVDYASIVRARDFKPAAMHTDAPLLATLAVRIGRTRLIDNLLLPQHLNNQKDLTAILGTG